MTGYSKLKRKKLPKYAMGMDLANDTQQADSGDFFSNNASSIGTAGNFLGNTIDGLNRGGTSTGSVALSGASGALKGAAAGTAIAPGVGTIVGAGIGLASGIIGGEKKRKAAIQQQNLQRTSVANNAANESNQELLSYDSNGVPNAQLYADGGPIDSTKTNPVITRNLKFLNAHAPQWGTPGQTTTNSQGTTTVNLQDNGNKSLYKPGTGGTSFYPSRDNRTTPTPATITTNSRWNGSYAEGGSIHIKKSHEGRFTKYKQRTGETTEEALHSKNPAVRKMANFARNAANWKHADGADLTEPQDPNVPPMYEAEQGETVQGNAAMESATPLASDVQQINGDTHENGGTMGVGGDRIYSDRLRISPSLQTILKTNGISVKGKSTYADVSNKLGKLKGKFEDKQSQGTIGRNTSMLMLPRIEQALDDTFNDQEASKMPISKRTFAYGGNVGMRLSPGAIINMFPNGGDPTDVPGYDDVLDQEAYPVQDAPVAQTAAAPTTNISTTQPSTFLNKATDFVDNNSGQIGNLGTYLANTGTINRLNTTVNPQYLRTPSYNYVDRSGAAISQNNALLRTGVRSLTNQGQSVNASNVGALYGRTIENASEIAAREGLRKDAYDQAFNERSDKINAENTGIANQAQDDSRNLYNEKLSAQLSARNAFQQGVLGNQQSKQAEKLDQQRIKLIGMAYNTNGVTDRSKAKIKALDPKLYAQMFPNE